VKETREFINRTPHLSAVWDEDIAYLKKRYELLSASPLFAGMVYTEDRKQLE
jgi:malate dehydrogenase (quinone)